MFSKDKELLQRAGPDQAYGVKANSATEQLSEVLARFNLGQEARPLSRCLACNDLLAIVSKDTIANRLPERVGAEHSEFWTCPSCERIYWRGSHYHRMREFAAKVLRQQEGGLA